MAVSLAEKTQVKEIVYDFMRHQLNRRGLQWNTCPPLPRPSEVTLALRRLGGEFTTEFRAQFSEMLDQLEVSPTVVQFIFMDVMNELLSEGITWARIVGAFAFSVELAVYCAEMNMSGMLDNIAFWLSSYVLTQLLPWIKNHEGWDGLVKFIEEREGAGSAESQWSIFKNVLCGLAVTALGVLALRAFLARRS